MTEEDFYETCLKRCNSTGDSEPPGWYIRARIGKSQGISRTPDGEKGRDVPFPVTEPQLRAIVEELLSLYPPDREPVFIECCPSKGGRCIAAFKEEPPDGAVAPAAKEDFFGAYVETLKIQRMTINDQAVQINKLFERVLKTSTEAGYMQAIMDTPPSTQRVDPQMQREVLTLIQQMFTPGDPLTQMEKLVGKLAEAKAAGNVTLTDDHHRRIQALIERVMGMAAPNVEQPASPPSPTPSPGAGP